MAKTPTPILSKSEKDTQAQAEEFLKNLPKNKNYICLFGDLGSGKTVFTKGLAKALGIENYSVKSPTYSLVREYIHKKGKLYHIDLYRLEAPDEIITRQIKELADEKNSLIIIEWADKLEELPEARVDICFEYVDPETRKITMF
jgi:tRNA threonylcarbamoyladenosine biosynthesis protein TsaE